MDIKAELEKNHSSESSKRIVAYIIDQPMCLKELMACFFSSDWRLNQRASWPLAILGEKNSALLKPYLPRLIKNMSKPHHEAVVRNTIRLWQFMELPEKHMGDIFDICFGYINDANAPIAVRAFSMTVCARICKKYPELKIELLSAIALHEEFGSPAFKSKAKQVRKILQ